MYDFLHQISGRTNKTTQDDAKPDPADITKIRYRSVQFRNAANSTKWYCMFEKYTTYILCESDFAKSLKMYLCQH